MSAFARCYVIARTTRRSAASNKLECQTVKFHRFISCTILCHSFRLIQDLASSLIPGILKVPVALGSRRYFKYRRRFCVVQNSIGRYMHKFIVPDLYLMQASGRMATVWSSKYPDTVINAKINSNPGLVSKRLAELLGNTVKIC